jgi:hypothetical protein
MRDCDGSTFQVLETFHGPWLDDAMLCWLASGALDRQLWSGFDVWCTLAPCGPYFLRDVTDGLLVHGHERGMSDQFGVTGGLLPSRYIFAKSRRWELLSVTCTPHQTKCLTRSS